MTGLDAFSQLLKVNPRIGGFLLVGLGVIAVGSIAVGFAGYGVAALWASLYVLGFAVVTTILYLIVSDRLLRTVLAWMLIATFGVFLLGLFDSAWGVSGRLPTTPCYLKMWWKPPAVCEAELAPVVETVRPGTLEGALRPRDGGPERLWAAQAGAEVLPPPPGAGQVYVQFGPNFAAPAAVDIATALAGSGWQVPGAAAGGEFVAASPGRNEVRFFYPEDRAAAEALARAAVAASPDAPIYVRDFSRLRGFAAAGQLELWLNAGPATP